ncbi:hypothetical protein QL285_025025 [Trifolium repens]|nr:hypothetical protein QL285_025025 [Trifolium repens]
MMFAWVSNEGDTEDEGNAVEYDENGVPKDDCYMWQQTVSKSNEDNVIKFPKRVVEQCLLKDQKLITLIDEANNKSYECEIETVNDGSNEKFVSKEWFKCFEDMGLKDGDKLLFTVQPPPIGPKEMYVILLEF